MAQSAPACKDTQDFQFKVHNKFAAFKKCGEPRSNVNLLAISCSRGLLFAGNPTQPELKVIILKDLASANKSIGEQPQARSVPLPSVPNYISCSADGTLLAVNLTQNGTSLLNIYAVQTFLTADVRLVYSIRLASEDYVHAVQLLWNPVLTGSLAVVLSNGALGMYTLKEGDTFEMHSLDKSQQVKCGCWSPKGKQIVLGFPGGKIQQFKPDLTPAKTLVCPPNIHDAPFDTIAIQWLSTYQFAVVFLQHGEDCSPALYILNAPKGGALSYVNYYDICYSLNGPRNHQFFFNHVAQWNLLLVTSANGVEVGIMGTFEAGDTPAWQHFTLLDEARIELPLTEGSQEETFPLGSVYDTSSTHQLSINEQKLPTMPMVHVLGTDGTLLSFNFLNLLPGAPSVCSPPPPVFDSSGQFRPLDTLLPADSEAEAATPPPEPQPTQSAPTDMSFAFTPNTVTSTPAPAKDKPPSLFSGFAAPAASTPFGVAPIAAPTATVASSASGFGGFGAPTTTPGLGSMFSAPGAPATATSSAFGGLALGKPNVMPSVASAPVSAPPSAPAAAAPAPINKPLYTVPHTFTPVATKQPAAASAAPLSSQSLDNTETIVRDMIALQIEAFNQDIQQQKALTTELLNTIAAPSSLKKYAKRLDDLEELNEQAKDVEFELDVQGLRQGLNEAYAIVAECRGKLEVYRKPDITRLMNSSSYDPAGRRMLARLQSYVAANEAQLRLVQQQVDLQWEQFQDVLRRKSKSSMHIPCLEGIYQQLTRLQNLASDQRIMQNSIKAKLKERGLLQAALLDQDKSRTRTNEAVETLADSILSMSLSQAVDSNAAKLTQHKLRQIRKVVQLQKVSIICPQRPDRVGLKSEVILETKRKAEMVKKAAAKATTANKATQAAAAPAPAPAPAPVAAPQLPKPTASKPAVSIPAISAAPIATPFAFSQSSPFVKTSSVTTTTTTVSSGEAPKPALSMFGGLSSGSGSSFGPVGGGLSFGGAPAADSSGGAKPSLFAGFGIGKEATAKPTPEPKKPQDPLAKETSPFGGDSEPTKAPETPKAETVGKSFAFTGFGGTGPPSSTFSFGGLGSSLGFGGVSKPDTTNAGVTSSASAVPRGLFAAAATKPNESEAAVSSSSATKPTATSVASLSAAPAMPTSNSGVTSTAPSSSDSLGGLFGSVNICKPQTKETSAASGQPGNIFESGFTFGGRGGDAPKGLFATITPVTTATETTAAAAPTMTKPEPVSSTAATAASTAAPATATSTATVAAAPTPTTTPAAPTVVAVPPNIAPATAPASTAALTITSSAAVPGSTFSFSNAFSSLGSAPAAAPVTASSSTASTVSNASSSVFGGSFSAAAASPATTAAPVASNPFQASTTSAAPAPATNLFGNVAKPEASVFGGSPAANATPAAAAASPPSGLFASAAISSPAPFGSPTSGAAASGGNIFSQANKPSVFGQPAAAASGGGSIFGGSAGSSFGSTSIFGGTNAQSPVSAPAAGSTSIFGQNVFGQPAAQAASPVAGGNIFASPVSASQQPQPSAFGGAGSIFGGPTTPNSSPASGGSIFGGGSSTGFGSFSQTAPAAGGFGSGFAQGGGSSVAQSGFGSPQTPQQPAPGGFGAKPVFGGSPAFGASPTFGGGATFGSPKGFGGFGASPNVAAPPAFGAPAKPAGGNIFDTLGGQESGLSFGNLAQTGNPNAQKPAFGGSSFMNYR
ncbi:nuclear pore complex protein Nup214 [Drosophila madeirensis]|uniref:Nuclear pore complex protein Nup214 n=1 Tax=Drosophila madeirensis TaxID=30013 RepID=A0AAU9GC98_DROMD